MAKKKTTRKKRSGTPPAKDPKTGKFLKKGTPPPTQEEIEEPTLSEIGFEDDTGEEEEILEQPQEPQPIGMCSECSLILYQQYAKCPNCGALFDGAEDGN